MRLSAASTSSTSRRRTLGLWHPTHDPQAGCGGETAEGDLEAQQGQHWRDGSKVVPPLAWRHVNFRGPLNGTTLAFFLSSLVQAQGYAIRWPVLPLDLTCRARIAFFTVVIFSRAAIVWCSGERGRGPPESNSRHLMLAKETARRAFVDP